MNDPLRELIDALDRRVPRVERVGEIRIARDAAALENDALTNRRAEPGGPHGEMRDPSLDHLK